MVREASPIAPYSQYATLTAIIKERCDVEFTKDEVLEREELPMDEDIDSRYFVTEGDYPNNQYWGSDGRCYVPVRYKAVPYKLKVIIKSRD